MRMLMLPAFAALLLTASLASAAPAALTPLGSEPGADLVSGVCVDTGAHCGPYNEAWVSIGPYQFGPIRVCVTSHANHILC